MIDNILAVGHERFFYLFNIISKTNFCRLEVDGYFGHLYFHDEMFYVADAYKLHCINKNGSFVWQSRVVAVDGVIVNSFTNDKIIGIGECDPPGDWRDFILNKKTGIQII